MRVIFEYDEESRKWEVEVHDAGDIIEARQAFSAVVLSCQELEADILEHTKTEVITYAPSDIRIIPAVRSDAKYKVVIEGHGDYAIYNKKGHAQNAVAFLKEEHPNLIIEIHEIR